MPSVSTRTRSPDRPRKTGDEAVGPKLVDDTPGCRARVSPMLGRTWRVRSSWSSTEMPPSTSPALRRTPVTTMSESWSLCAASAVGAGAAAESDAAALLSVLSVLSALSALSAWAGWSGSRKASAASG